MRKDRAAESIEVIEERLPHSFLRSWERVGTTAPLVAMAMQGAWP